VDTATDSTEVDQDICVEARMAMHEQQETSLKPAISAGVRSEGSCHEQVNGTHHSAAWPLFGAALTEALRPAALEPQQLERVSGVTVLASSSSALASFEAEDGTTHVPTAVPQEPLEVTPTHRTSKMEVECEQLREKVQQLQSQLAHIEQEQLVSQQAADQATAFYNESMAEYVDGRQLLLDRIQELESAQSNGEDKMETLNAPDVTNGWQSEKTELLAEFSEWKAKCQIAKEEVDRKLEAALQEVGFLRADARRLEEEKRKEADHHAVTRISRMEDQRQLEQVQKLREDEVTELSRSMADYQSLLAAAETKYKNLEEELNVLKRDRAVLNEQDHQVLTQSTERRFLDQLASKDREIVELREALSRTQQQLTTAERDVATLRKQVSIAGQSQEERTARSLMEDQQRRLEMRYHNQVASLERQLADEQRSRHAAEARERDLQAQVLEQPRLLEEREKSLLAEKEAENEARGKWEAQADGVWWPWEPGVPFTGTPGEHLKYEGVYMAIFESGGVGVEQNIQSGKYRKLRRRSGKRLSSTLDVSPEPSPRLELEVSSPPRQPLPVDGFKSSSSSRTASTGRFRPGSRTGSRPTTPGRPQRPIAPQAPAAVSDSLAGSFRSKTPDRAMPQMRCPHCNNGFKSPRGVKATHVFCPQCQAPCNTPSNSSQVPDMDFEIELEPLVPDQKVGVNVDWFEGKGALIKSVKKDGSLEFYNQNRRGKPVVECGDFICGAGGVLFGCKEDMSRSLQEASKRMVRLQIRRMNKPPAKLPQRWM
jgi:hypothetical protein